MADPRPQPSAEPVAWMYVLGAQRVLLHEQLHRDGILRGETGWTETPLYPASALEQVRKDAAWEAAKEINALKDALAQARAEIAELKDQANG